jgi:hypothetical protein
VKIQERVIAFSPNLQDELHKIAKFLSFFDNKDSLQMRVPFDEPAVRSFDEICEGSTWEPGFEKSDSRRRHDDIADAPQPDEEDFF